MRTAHTQGRKLIRSISSFLLYSFSINLMAQIQIDSIGNDVRPSAESVTGDGSPANNQHVKILNPIYFGYEVSMSVQEHGLKSSIKQLNGLVVSQIGTRIGLKFSNSKAGLKAYGGMYYSDGDIPYTVDMLDGGVTGQLYLLRLNKVVYHSIEPYAIAGIAYQQARFYGTYLCHERGNNSFGDDPFLANVNWLQATGGIGAEYQFENEHFNFLHLFAELRCGVPFLFHASSQFFF